MAANHGIFLWYRKHLSSLVRSMSDDVENRLKKAYQSTSLANDADDNNPSTKLKTAITALGAKWAADFEVKATSLAKAFFDQVLQSVDGSLSVQLKSATGFAVPFQMTKEMDMMKEAIIGENVSLIKSIPQQYFTQVESMVMQSVIQGGDIKTLADNLHNRFGITKRRAVLIARDQNFKANSALSRVRQQAAGITEGIWQHSGGGNEPRPDHVRATGKKFLLSQGCKISGEYIQPGQLINCGCSWRPVIPF